MKSIKINESVIRKIVHESIKKICNEEYRYLYPENILDDGTTKYITWNGTRYHFLEFDDTCTEYVIDEIKKDIQKGGIPARYTFYRVCRKGCMKNCMRNMQTFFRLYDAIEKNK